MKLAYETLYDEKRRMEYDADTDFDKDDDDEDADEIFSTAKNEQMR
jgi:curved DNA-binding protein CbpA